MCLPPSLPPSFLTSQTLKTFSSLFTPPSILQIPLHPALFHPPFPSLSLCSQILPLFFSPQPQKKPVSFHLFLVTFLSNLLNLSKPRNPKVQKSTPISKGCQKQKKLMGKYMKKGKITGDIAMMEISQSSSSLGVRTRARTLALQPNSELSYLQLRNRRLEKPQPPFQNPPAKHGVKQGIGNSRVCVSEKKDGCFGKVGKLLVMGRCDGIEIDEFCDVGIEASCGENNLDFEARERSTCESTPCSLTRGTETIATPGSTTRSTCSGSANRQARNAQRAIPSTPEMEEFFAGFELHQQKQFIDKYNYDIMNDLPLPGRYEWVRVDN